METDTNLPFKKFPTCVPMLWAVNFRSRSAAAALRSNTIGFPSARSSTDAEMTSFSFISGVEEKQYSLPLA
jgi:hypothetical protein